ncbi:hypothetical protein G4B88_009159 [Cannabis sativa]|uniref:Uncharacterized protein n=1 Tax=Cannabis sativa TaxID=3483 RepID=A0A7J6G2V8_CANSA|nr:hypothetical protein G4B88_009159 [Cannabis sativa]
MYVHDIWRIVRNSSTEEFESIPYICTLLNSLLWTHYGLTKPREVLLATVFLFLLYAHPKMRSEVDARTNVIGVLGVRHQSRFYSLRCSSKIITQESIISDVLVESFNIVHYIISQFIILNL